MKQLVVRKVVLVIYLECSCFELFPSSVNNLKFIFVLADYGEIVISVLEVRVLLKMIRLLKKIKDNSLAIVNKFSKFKATVYYIKISVRNLSFSINRLAVTDCICNI